MKLEIKFKCKKLKKFSFTTYLRLGTEPPLLMCSILGKMLYTKYVLTKYWLASLVTDGKQFEN